ncbi:MAG: hypothetical protein A2X94_08450 [Bdellovibrionales bacterium GWB1_55_8]|nr:MAG: hypothetical protein A2X94_08450 [Bdellovibrionales bacterium GWB1_55_8]
MDGNRFSGRFLLSCLRLLSALIALTWTSSAFALEPPILRISIESEPLTFDWNNTRSATDRFILSFIARSLLRYDTTGVPVCDLCTSFQLSPDRKTLHFEIDAQAVWSDGSPVIAQQFVDSFQRLLNPVNNFPAASDFRRISGARQPGRKWNAENLNVRAQGKNKLSIELSEPFNLFTHLLTTVATSPIRKELLQPKDTGEEQATMAALGPYQLAGWERGKRIVLEGNPKFTGSRPVYRVELIHGLHAEQIKRFASGKLDIVTGPTTEDILKLPGQKVQVNPYWATRGMVFNVRRGPGSDLHFRRAALFALDRNSLPAFLKTGERKATGLIPPGLLGHRELPLASHDPVRAVSERNLMAKQKSPTPKLRLLVQDSEKERQVGSWVASQLEKVGISVEVLPRKTAQFFQDLDKSNFEAAIITWGFRIATPLELLRNFQTQSDKNYGRWTHVAYDSLLARLLNENTLEHDSGAGSAIIDQVCRIMETEEVAAIPLGYPTQPFLLGRRVESFATTPFGDPNLLKIQLKQ